MLSEILMLALGLSIFVTIWTWLRDTRLRNAIQAGLDKAYRDNADYVRIPVAQAESWGFRTRLHDGVDVTWRDRRDFNKQNQTTHPGRLRAWRRNKL